MYNLNYFYFYFYEVLFIRTGLDERLERLFGIFSISLIGIIEDGVIYDENEELESNDASSNDVCPSIVLIFPVADGAKDANSVDDSAILDIPGGLKELRDCDCNNGCCFDTPGDIRSESFAFLRISAAATSLLSRHFAYTQRNNPIIIIIPPITSFTVTVVPRKINAMIGVANA